MRRQVKRWSTQLQSYGEFAGWPGPDGLAGHNRIAAWLAKHCPEDIQPGIIHGDYHLANILFHRDSPEIAAVLDWELTTIGDQLIDLAWLAVTWSRGPDDTPVVDVQRWTGFPNVSVLFAHYARCAGRALGRMDWYFVLPGYKMGIILEGTYARARAGPREAEHFAGRLTVLPFDSEAAHTAEIRTELEGRACVIGPYDLMIAGHARSRGLVVVTGNLGEFQRVQGLRCEDWLV